MTLFRILRPFGLVRSSTTSVVANILLKLQGLTSIFFLEMRFLGCPRCNSLPPIVEAIGQSRSECLRVEDIFIGLGGSNDIVWLYRNEYTVADISGARTLSAEAEERIHCVPYEEAVRHSVESRCAFELFDEEIGMDSATVVSATLFRPIGLAGASKENATLIKFTFGFGGRKAYILVPDGQLESLQDSLYLTCRRSHIDQIYIEVLML